MTNPWYIVLLFSIFCLDIHGQNEFAQNYTLSGGNFGSIQTLENGDLFIANISTSNHEVSVFRLTSQGIPLWSREIFGHVCQRQEFYEDGSGNVTLAVSYQDSVSGKYFPAFIKFNPTGDVLEANYYNINDLEAFVSDSHLSPNGLLISKVGGEAPFFQGRFRLDPQSGSATCRTYPLWANGSGSSSIIAADNGSNMLFYQDHYGELKAKKIGQNGSMIWQKAYEIQDNPLPKIKGAAKIHDDLYVVYCRKLSPAKLFLLFINADGDVLSCHGYIPNISFSGFEKLWITPSQEILIYTKSGDSDGHSFSLVDTLGNILQDISFDANTNSHINDIHFIDDSLAYIIYSNKLIYLKNIYGPSGQCENTNSFSTFPSSALASDHNSELEFYIPDAIGYEPLVEIISIDTLTFCPVIPPSYIPEHKGELILFPNPFTEKARIKVDQIKGKVQIEVIDVSGRILRSEVHYLNGPSFELERKSLNKGAYLLRIVGDPGIYLTNFIVQ
ncbi:MAG: T9SS type A sorting domain-containing protein [Flavobacteriales bacterium]|nr:T9SS type A sorting domain-containing protein [Flavobacteriales bacterium]